MIRQLRRLTRPVPAAGGDAAAPAVYASARGHGFVLRPATDQGFEGVACVDDAARAAVVHCALWRVGGAAWAAAAARRYLAFVLYMQEPDGSFANFIVDWRGRKNLTGPTSAPGGPSWAARALHALACGVRAFGDDAYGGAFQRCAAWLAGRTGVPLDILALETLALLEYAAASGGVAGARALALAEAIAAAAVDGVLPDLPGRREVHLWGRLQEAALARAGATCGRPDLVEAARVSADAALVPPVACAFTAAASTVPFDVSCVVLGLATVADATGEAPYARHAALARRWFRGRNAARRAVYDPHRGLVHDGIDAGRVNPNSGAEANIEGAMALLPELRPRIGG